MFRNVSILSHMKSPVPWRLSGNSSEHARVDSVIFQGVTVLGEGGGRTPLTWGDISGGLGEFATNVSVCALAGGCGERVLPRNNDGWTQDQICGRTPQPVVDGTQLPPLNMVDEQPYCGAAHRV